MAPSRATFVRSTRSEAMRPSATTKMTIATVIEDSAAGVVECGSSATGEVVPTSLPGAPPTTLTA